MKTDIRQHDITDCAAAAICSIARYYGIDIPLTVIREASGTGSLGTSIKGIIDACRTLGFDAEAYKSPERDTDVLKDLKTPAILHIINRQGDLHFVVLYGTGRRKAIVMDPARGKNVRISFDALNKMWTGYLIVISPDPGRAVSNSHSVSTLKRLACILASTSRSKDLFLSLLGSFFYIAIGIFTAVFLQNIIDRVLPGGDILALARAGCIMAAVTLGGLAIGYGRTVFALRAGLRIDGSLVLSYLRKLFRLPAGFFAHRGAGELNSRINDAVKVRYFLTSGLTEIISSLLILIASACLMFYYNWHLAALAFSFIPLYIILFIISDNVNKRVKREVIEDAAAFEEKSVECISSMRAIKYFDRSGTGYLALERRYASLCASLYRGGRAIGRFTSAGDTISKTMTLSVLLAGSMFVMRGTLTTGELVSFYSLITFFSDPLSQLASISDSYNEARIALERLEDITALEGEPEGGIVTDMDGTHDIEFKNVCFSYPGAPELLRNFNVTVKAGGITAVTGESGCGKSTLAALLMRDYRVNSGRILVGSTDILLTDIAEWRNYITIVPQDTALMNMSLLDNVTGGSRNPDMEKAVRILEDLGLREFITSLPTGILTTIGERGALLSGGQRQRIALARALYREPKVLILDEATSSLDDESQDFILNKVRAFRDSGGTVLMITHKKDNLEIADYIMDMNECALGRPVPDA